MTINSNKFSKEYFAKASNFLPRGFKFTGEYVVPTKGQFFVSVLSFFADLEGAEIKKVPEELDGAFALSLHDKTTPALIVVRETFPVWFVADDFKISQGDFDVNKVCFESEKHAKDFQMSRLRINKKLGAYRKN